MGNYETFDGWRRHCEDSLFVFVNPSGLVESTRNLFVSARRVVLTLLLLVPPFFGQWRLFFWFVRKIHRLPFEFGKVVVLVAQPLLLL